MAPSIWDGIFESAQLVRENEQATLEFVVPEGLPSFDGHFPGQPILPAVAILELSLHCARRLEFVAQTPLRRVGNAKFLEPVRPGSRVKMRFTKADAGVDVEWRLSVHEDAWSKASEFDLSVES